jgi:hypothetical protein
MVCVRWELEASGTMYSVTSGKQVPVAQLTEIQYVFAVCHAPNTVPSGVLNA